MNTLESKSLLIDDRSAWLEARRKCITATDISAIVGLNVWSSPLTVWRDKMGLSPELEVNDAMQLGIDIEPWIGAMFAKNTGKTLTKGDFTLSDTEPIFGATPDFLVGDDELLECKYAGVNSAKAFGEEFTDYVPDHYLIQVQWQLAVTGRKKGYLAVFAPSISPRVRTYEIDRDDDLITRLQFQARKFWHEQVVKETPPEISGSRADTEAINAIPADPQSDYIRATEPIEIAIGDLSIIKAKLKEVEEEKNRLENVIKDFMGSEEILMSDCGKFTWKPQDRTSLSLSKLPPDLKEQCAPFTTVTTSRVFRTPFKTEG